MGSRLANDLTAMIGSKRRLRWGELAERIEGQRERGDVSWARYRPADVQRFRLDVAAMANGGGGYVIVGVPQRRGLAVPSAMGPPPLRVGVQPMVAWVRHGLSQEAMTPLPDVGWSVAVATEDTGFLVLEVAAATGLPVAVAHHRSWTMPFRRGRRTDYPRPWDALSEIEQRDRDTPTVEPVGAA